MALGFIVLWIMLGALGVTIALTLGVRISDRLARRRTESYERIVRDWLTEYAVSAREDPPPPGKSRRERRVMRRDLRALAPYLKGDAQKRVELLFADYGLVEIVERELLSRDPLTRVRASDTLGAMHVAQSTPWLRDGLRHPDPLLRLSCARALADLGDVGAVPEIMAALAGQHSHSVETTDILLGFGPDAVPALRRELAGGPTEQRRLAASALGEMRATAALPELRTALHDQEPELAAAAARALGRIGDAASAGDLVWLLEGEREWFVRVSAAHALGAQDVPSAAPALVAALSDEHWDVRNAAAGALRDMGDTGLRAVTDALDDIPGAGLAHYAGLLDVADRMGAVIERAAGGDEQLERFVRRTSGAGVHARLEELAPGEGTVAAFATEVLEWLPTR